MQTNQNSEQLFTKKETNRDESHVSDQSKRKAIIQQRITAFLSLRDTDKKTL